MSLFPTIRRDWGVRVVCGLFVGGALLAANVFVQAGSSSDDAASAEVPKEAPKVEATEKGKSGEKQPEKSTEKTPEKTPEKPVDKSATKPGESKPGQKSGEKPVDKSATKSGEPKPGEKTTEKKAPEKGTKPSEKTVVDKTKPEKGKGDKPGSDEKKPVDKREMAALGFAKTHHPELVELLTNLQRGNPGEYQKAIKELSAAVERITRIQEKMPERYDFALNAWKLDSRIRLLTARLVMADNPAQEAELKALIQQRNELKLRELKIERERVATRLKNIERDIAELEKDQTGAVQRDLQEVRNHLNEKARELKKRGAKAGAEKPTEKPGAEKKSKEPSKSDKTEKPAPEKTNPEKTKTKKSESKDAAT